jgi:hypothetical protein
MDHPLPSTVIAFQRRHRRLWLAPVALLLPCVVGPMVFKAYDLPSVNWLLVGFALGFLTLLAVVSGLRCPACDSPQRGWRPLYCQRCEAPLLPIRRPLGSPEPPRLATRQEWQSTEEKAETDRRNFQTYRSTRFAGILHFLVCMTFVTGILDGVGGRNEKPPDSSLTHWLGPQAPRWVSIGFAVACAFFAWRIVRASYKRYRAAGISPERARRASGGLLISSGLLMMALGIGGLIYSACTAWPPEDFALWIAFSAYTLAGLYVLLRGVWTARLPVI